MRRIATRPRPGWESKVEAAGLSWHTPGQAYWNESAFYAFTALEIDVLEASTNELAEMSLAAAQRVIDQELYTQMGIVEAAIPLIKSSWEAEPPSLYGRFDLAYDGTAPPKLLEYNADTPTSLVEAAVAQWFWLEDTHSDSDQFNAIHERLIERWREMKRDFPGQHIDFCSMDDAEDRMTVTYLLDTAQQGGLSATSFLIDEIGWDGAKFLAPNGRPLTSVFKLYPWEWMIREEFGKHLTATAVIWMEPPWKMLLANKGLLPVLWDLYPGHPNLVPASWNEPQREAWVRKPLLGREGANVTVHSPAGDLATSGQYGEEGFIYQDFVPVKDFDGRYPVIGSWVIGHEAGAMAAGIGIRESETPITNNFSQFVPHLFG